MVIEFYQDGDKKRLCTPRKIKSSTVEIRKRKKDIWIIVRKTQLNDNKRNKLRFLGDLLLSDKIDLISYRKKKDKIKKKKAVLTTKMPRDKNTIVKIQYELFENN